MDQGQLARIAAQVIDQLIQKYPQLDLQVQFFPIPGRSHTYTRQMTLRVLGKDISQTYQFDDVYAPPRTLDAIISMELEVLLQSTIQQFIEEQRAKLRRTAIRA